MKCQKIENDNKHFRKINALVNIRVDTWNGWNIKIKNIECKLFAIYIRYQKRKWMVP